MSTEEFPEIRQRLSGSPVTPTLTFGIYPGSATGIGPGLLAGPADDAERIIDALDQLQGTAHDFVVRCYMIYIGNGASGSITPLNIEHYACERRKLDLVLCFRATDSDIAAWCSFIRQIVQRYGPYLTSLQITEEPNNPDAASGGDGSSPNIVEALHAGVIAAKSATREYGYDVQIGFNATPSFNPADTFWSRIGQLATPSFLDALDYIGLDFFPDVFRPLAPDGTPGDLRTSVSAVLQAFRGSNLATGKIPSSIPIHIGENGWPTGDQWSYERQAAVLETVVRTIVEQSTALNITHYTYFDLRDAHSAHADRFWHFGLMRDDYTPKPAFATYRHLIDTLSTKR